MNRHHPYGGGGYDGQRGGSFSGPGPERHHRGGGRGRGNFGRGRGGGGGGSGGGGYGQSTGGGASYDGNMSYSAYDQPQEDMNGYNSNYDSSNSYYQNLGGSSQYGYNQGYGKQEDDTVFEEDSLGRIRRPVRKDRDDKVHDSIIEQRIQRERPCRTLFIRNIKYETNSSDVRRLFEEHGDIKTFFDLISTRGMVFVTYYDLRAAERARERLQGSEISGRPIDVHYSLPRDDRGEDKNSLQGCLQVTLRNSPSGQMIDDNEVRRKFQQFGDVKSVQPVGERIDSRYVEFYDTRACDDAYDRLRHQSLQDGVMDISFAWDVNDGGAQGSHRPNNWEEGGRRGGRGGGGRGRGGGRGGRGGGGGNRGGPDDDYERKDTFGRERGGGRGGRGGGGGGGAGRYEDDWSNRKDNFNDRYEGPRFGPNSNNFGTNTAGPTFNPPPPAPLQPQSSDDRLEQAKKVQQLLAALKQPASNAPPVPPPGSAPLPPIPGVPPQMTQSLAATPMHNPYYPPPGPGGHQPPYLAPNMYGPPPGQSSNTTQTGAAPPPIVSPPPPAVLNALPPNVLALLQSAQQQQQPGGGPPPGMPYSMPSPMMGTPPPGAGAPGNASYQQLMAMMQNKRP
ncbi:hypothetical protein E1B28_001659 [Marasmius oreades]|uniref:RRM domain-containing protein n=1 Tax=Marasmius oreades TaxID=181124 RepID=A0A9P8AFM4_9AGAR|nr:uncharacterized protein E1B28_001659 [Marasmius oreades]KAG7099852.1 hypothetical protein E1B28_001659 [Marasmius oreades]